MSIIANVHVFYKIIFNNELDLFWVRTLLLHDIVVINCLDNAPVNLF